MENTAINVHSSNRIEIQRPVEEIKHNANCLAKNMKYISDFYGLFDGLRGVRRSVFCCTRKYFKF